MSTEAVFQNEDDFVKALLDCRSDSCDKNWVLAHHADGNPSLIAYLASGNNGVEEMKGFLEDNKVMYGLVRLELPVDQSVTVKFIYIRWNGKEVPFTKRGKYGVVHGSIEKRFHPHHIFIEAENRSELDHELLMNKVEENSFTKNKVLDKNQATERKAYDRGFTGYETGNTKKKVTSGFVGVQGKSGASLNFDDSITDAVADVRSDSSNTNWFVAVYQDGNPKSPLVCHGTGDNGIHGIIEVLTNDIVAYALCRVTDVVDDISTVKFVYIQWVGDNVKPMVKARISTHKADLEKIFHPAHVTIFANRHADISEKEIMDKVQSSSGSKSHVRNK
ncbi:uncharacterized protein LOC124451386 [Xenia sp. Carnegie-2017]|uniref:uncharacterized protein LOC124451386 n=1 Tax=Xenia sp. Carnegie-2017 TaxID=2897299 RepID=UPI001F03E7B8|nr:uncharacterized protein LOC124451386 [Xenia sp. Carnegie-2017]